MSKISGFFECVSCEHRVVQWTGVCSACGEWNTLLKGPIERKQKLKVSTITELSKSKKAVVYDTGDSELNRVLGSGLTRGSLTLLSGEPGVGKSTLILKVLNDLIAKNQNLKVLYISGEESLEQLSQRAGRLKITTKKIHLLNTSSWHEVLDAQRDGKYEVVLIDSIQTLRDNEISSPQGSPAQVKGITNELLEKFKSKNITTIIIGHKTKDGSVAGPKLLEHMVDTVLNFTLGSDQVRSLRATKNRFGATHEVAQYEMGKEGLTRPRETYYQDQVKVNEVGMSRFLTRKLGKNNLITLQVIAIENKYGAGKRVAQGLDIVRLNLLLAIIEKSLKLPISNYDIYFKSSWSEKLDEHEADAAIVAAILASVYEKVLPGNIYFSGELSLGGNIKSTKSNEEITQYESTFIHSNVKNINELKEFIKDKVS